MTARVQETWAEALAAREAWLRAAGRPGTSMKLRRVQLGLLARDTGAVSPWMLDAEDLLLWLASKDWAPNTRQSYRASLRTFWAWGVKTGRTPFDAAESLPRVVSPRGRPRPVPDSVISAARDRATADEELMIRLGSECGLRCREIALTHSDDLFQDLLGWSLTVHGKGGHQRAVPLSPRMAIALRTRGAGWIFPGRVDGHISPVVVSRMLSDVLGPGWTAHNLRHRFASTAYSAQRDLRAVQELLGHASPVTTAIYTAIPDGALRAAVMAAAC